MSLALLLVAGCSFEFRPPPVLVGSYELSDGCRLEVDELAAFADCPGPSAVTVQVSVGDDQVTFDQVAVTETETHTECWSERVCTRTYTGAVIREARAEGTPYDGRFARLGGEWNGTLLMATSCAKEVAQPSAPDWCKTTIETMTYTVSATVSEHEARITWSSSDGAGGEFKALETKGGVTVADTFYERMEEAAPAE